MSVEGQRLTLGTALADIRARLSAVGIPDAAIDARMLAGGVLGLSALVFHTEPERPLSPVEAEKLEAAVLRRLKREPVHRILGRREFHGLDLRLSAETLEPRPDTEVLVDCCLPYLERIVRVEGQASVVDLGTGTGAIALALLAALPGLVATGVDISPDALTTAAANAEDLQLSPRFKTVQSNWADRLDGQFDMVVSNPPYIVSSVMAELEPEVRLYDPARALDGGTDGLDAYRAIATAAPGLLFPEGIVALEIGYDQKHAVTALFEASGFDRLEAVRDYGGNDRVLVFGKRSDRP